MNPSQAHVFFPGEEQAGDTYNIHTIRQCECYAEGGGGEGSGPPLCVWWWETLV